MLFPLKKLREFIKANGYVGVALCGLDEGGCVLSTAKSAIESGLQVEILQSGIATVFPTSKIEKIRSNLQSKGVKYT